MKPLRLTLEGFTCFKEPQPPIDFSTYELFGITGATGAGKSSLLDAILFALYGRVPRVGKTVSELISLGRERMSVVLDFRVGDKEFRLTRVARRGRSTQAQLDELKGGLELAWAGGVTKVDAEIERLLGLRYEAFTQAVILPQGDFARFLKSAPRERREILRDLLRLSIYERMRKSASEMARDLQQRHRSLDERLTQDYQDATPAHLDRLAQEEGELRELVDRAAKDIAEAEVAFQQLQQSLGMSEELHEKRDRLRELARQSEAMESSRARLRGARRVAPLLPLLENLHAIEVRSEEAARREEEALRQLEQSRKQSEHARAAEKRAAKNATKLSSLRKRLRALDEIEGLWEPQRQAEARLVKARDEVAAFEQEWSASESESEEIASGRASLEKRITETVHALSKLGYHEAAFRKLDAAREQAVELRALREQLRALSEEENRREAEKRRSSKDLNRMRGEGEKLEARLESETSSRQAAERAIQAAHHADAVSLLRQELDASRPCPVCEQIVSDLPPHQAGSGLEALAAELEAHRSEEARLRELLEACRSEQRSLSDRLDHLSSDRSLSERRELESSSQSLVASLGALLKELDVRVTRDLLEDVVLEHARRMAARRDEAKKLEAAKTALESEERVLAERAKRLVSRQRTSKSRGKKLRERVSSYEKELREYEDAISKVTRGEDVARLRSQLESEAQQIEARQQEIGAQTQSASAKLATAQELAEVARSQAVVAASELEAASGKVETALAKAGIGSASDAWRLGLDPSEVDRLEAALESYLEERRAHEGRVAELETALDGRVVTPEQTSDAGAALQEMRQTRERQFERLAELRAQLAVVREKLKKAEGLTAERERLGSEQGLYQALAADLRSERFQAYLLEEAFRDLVRGASERLRKISGRYTLEYEDGGFNVQDHDNASERRSADTLSGGETFLTSLALALELSEQVQRAAGAVRLDSLFIDEGFGTLDAETLDTVAAAVETLPVGGRVVGIITHVQELMERLPAVMRVEKTASGARVLQGDDLAYNAPDRDRGGPGHPSPGPAGTVRSKALRRSG